MAIQLPRGLPFTLSGFQRLVDAVTQLITGRGNYTGQVTLAVAPATTTTVVFVNCSSDCQVFLQELTAHAAAARATTWISAVNQGSFVITHASSAQNDRSFAFACIGG